MQLFAQSKPNLFYCHIENCAELQQSVIWIAFVPSPVKLRLPPRQASGNTIIPMQAALSKEMRSACSHPSLLQKV